MNFGNQVWHTLNLVESAAAAPLAAALRLRERLAGRRVALICTGGNATLDQLRDVLGSAEDETATTADRPHSSITTLT